MNDDIVEIQISKFAMIIKRRTILYMFVVFLVGLLTMYVFEKEVVELSGPEDMFIDLNTGFDLKEPDKSITWLSFYDIVASTGWRHNKNFEFTKNFKSKIIEWEGEVIRVSGIDEDIEFEGKDIPSHILVDQKEKNHYKELNLHNVDFPNAAS